MTCAGLASVPTKSLFRDAKGAVAIATTLSALGMDSVCSSNIAENSMQIVGKSFQMD